MFCKSPSSFFIINSLVPGLIVPGICKVVIKFPCLSVLIDFREILRKDFSDEYIKDKIKFAMNIKPKKHDFEINKFSKTYVTRHMNVTGG